MYYENGEKRDIGMHIDPGCDQMNVYQLDIM